MNNETAERLRLLLADLDHATTAAALAASEIRALLDPAMSKAAQADRPGIVPPRVDGSMFCIDWGGRTCFLGSTCTFRLLECLARRPNRFVSHDVLLREVWRGEVKEVVTIRSVVRHLRGKLRGADMHPLADAIVGHCKSYGLDLRRIA